MTAFRRQGNEEFRGGCHVLPSRRELELWEGRMTITGIYNNREVYVCVCVCVCVWGGGGGWRVRVTVCV